MATLCLHTMNRLPIQFFEALFLLMDPQYNRWTGFLVRTFAEIPVVLLEAFLFLWQM